MAPSVIVEAEVLVTDSFEGVSSTGCLSPENGLNQLLLNHGVDREPALLDWNLAILDRRELARSKSCSDCGWCWLDTDMAPSLLERRLVDIRDETVTDALRRLPPRLIAI